MTDAELLIECKKGLGMQTDSTEFDGVIAQKVLAIKAFIKDAGVSDTVMNSDLCVGTIVMGVTDLWSTEGGNTKFSPLFYTFLGQLSAASLVSGEVI